MLVFGKKAIIFLVIIFLVFSSLASAQNAKLLKGKIVILDPGHGGNESGTTAEGITEKKVNLEVALRLERLLIDSGATVYMTRKDDRYVSLEERVRLFHKHNADLILSLHHNAKPYDPAANEVSVYRPSFPTKEAKRFSKLVMQELVIATGNPRGALGPANYYILENSKALPVVLAEPYYFTFPEHLKLLKKPETWQLEAEAYYKAILLFFDESVEI